MFLCISFRVEGDDNARSLEWAGDSSASRLAIGSGIIVQSNSSLKITLSSSLPLAEDPEAGI